ncbi:MAG: nicotinate-nicotinamide nucleotide adenylyltransferase [Gammaproteobacteria bacterium]
MSRRIAALLGGAFDPVHGGHVALARRALKDLPVAAVFLIPNGAPPHRPAPQLPWARRVAMCAAALRGIPRARTGLDEPPGAPRRTADTLRRYRRRRWKVVLILGADAFAELHRWHRWREIARRANFAVARRGARKFPPAARRGLCAARRAREIAAGAGRVFWWNFRPPDISATAIRRAQKRAGR